MDMEKSKEVTVDDILHILGPFGKFNILNTVLILFPVLLAGMYSSVFNFEAMDLKYRCTVPDCEDPSIVNYSIPHTKDGEPSKCRRYAPFTNISSTNDTCSPHYYDTSTEIECDSYVYFEEHSIVKELKDDMENYIYYTTMGGKAKIKIDVVPHKFDCQPHRKRQSTTMICRPAAVKRRRQQIIEEILSESTSNIEIGNPQESNTDAVLVDTVENIAVDSVSSKISDQKISVETQTCFNNRNVAVQVNNRSKYRSVSGQCKILSIGVDKSCSPIKTGSTNTATSPIKPLRQNSLLHLLEDAQKSLSSNSYTHSNSSQDIYEPFENTDSSAMDSSSFQSPVKKSEILKVTNYLINDNLKAYTYWSSSRMECDARTY
ncbi:unnamed protein product [Colias eurytheme]|nr:unnamed protein product [Colias eurytheme]